MENGSLPALQVAITNYLESVMNEHLHYRGELGLSIFEIETLQSRHMGDLLNLLRTQGWVIRQDEDGFWEFAAPETTHEGFAPEKVWAAHDISGGFGNVVQHTSYLIRAGEPGELISREDYAARTEYHAIFKTHPRIVVICGRNELNFEPPAPVFMDMQHPRYAEIYERFLHTRDVVTVDFQEGLIVVYHEPNKRVLNTLARLGDELGVVNVAFREADDQARERQYRL